MTKIAYLAAAVTLAVLAACTQNQKPDAGLDAANCQPMLPDTAYLAVDTTQAWSWIDNYQKTNPNGVKYFTVDATDLWEAMALQNRPAPCSHYPKVRMYLGLDSANVMHLLLTPADSTGSPITMSGYFSGLTRPTGLSSSQVQSSAYMADFTKPCPPTCPD